MLKRLPKVLLLLLAAVNVGAQDIDVLHYNFNLTLSDQSDSIKGIALINFETVKPRASVTFDLAAPRRDGKGMAVRSVKGADVESWSQRDDKVAIVFDLGSIAKTSKLVQIEYGGIPADGLIISKNKWGERTFFADNWPNRAHQWLPCNDRPDDKATFEFQVTVPKGYRVISNGELQMPRPGNTGIVPPDTSRSFAHWRCEVPLPTKVMVIGAARFASKTFEDSPPGIPVSAWVFPQDSAKGFYDYALAPSILKFFSSYIAPFPYKKLANVQSKTIFGGMENASAIFYAEESVTGDRKWEDVIAHEIAHQWFGDMASEKSFAHLWLSEGFATYMTNIYIEQKYGVDSMNKRLAADREAIRKSGRVGLRTVVDDTTNLMSLLNTNSYQKGGWVLHMLRREVGDSVFRKVIRTYYEQYKGKNATTEDFGSVVEQVTGTKWGWFFEQWLYRPSMPGLNIQETLRKGKVKLSISQSSFARQPFYFTLEIGVVDDAGKMTIHDIPVTESLTEVKLDIGERNPVKIVVDPNTNLLFYTQGATYWKAVKQNRATGEQIRVN
ncbi:M1 family peptidase [Flaviaesturariibacter flavus]|uniref:Aminopeptidase N n=1 Tax=Flaviaesturariibacter flavus TaxID=2502780 RepID=A0A4R1BKA1_9BACT|nr:M1 family metallopeptidase [Flaviaesturariibacter flavus]TCJ17845.1 M1 family peptidase [Flaviaesturariibacter flavus]